MAGRRLPPGVGGSPAFADRLRSAEHLLYLIVGATLAIAGFVLYADVVYTFVDGVVRGTTGLADAVLSAAEGLLLVFIFAELLHTVRVLIAHDELRIEPFLVVGIVAAIRRFIVASAEAPKALGTPRFRDLMLELGVLVAAVLVLALGLALLTNRDSPSGTDGDSGDG